MDKRLITTRNNYKKYFSKYLVLGIFFCLFAVICFALDLVIEGIGFFVVVLLLIPFYFGTVVYALNVPNPAELNFSNYFRVSFSYYSPNFFGSFHLIKTYLKAILVELSLILLVSIPTYYIFTNIYQASFTDAFEAFYSYIISANTDAELLEEIMLMNEGIIDNFLFTISQISTIGGAFTMVFGISFNTFNCYFKANMKAENAALNKASVDATMRLNRRNMAKDYWSLNWPLFVILTVGLVSGSLISILLLKDVSYLLVLGLSISFILLIPYFPFYLMNMQALFNKYRMSIYKGINMAFKEALRKIERTQGVPEDAKKELDETLEELDNIEKEAEEDNKKDPNEGS